MGFLQKMWRSVFDGTIFTVSWRFWGVKALKPEMLDMMLLEREWFTDKSTIGTLSFDGDHVCFTLEDTCRRKKQSDVTAIPSGRYEVVMDYSERFKRVMPHILAVPFFEGVRIHAGNTAENTEGCVLVGLRRDKDVIYDSKKALEIVEAKIVERLAKGKLYISVVGGISKEQFEA